MSGHSHWAGIKHKKEIKDAKRGILFSKLLNMISVAAKPEPNPEFNPHLRDAILKAKENSVPQDNIDRAIKKAAEKNSDLEELTLEAYGPGGIAMLMVAITDNRNRTIPQIKKVLADGGGKWAEPGSVLWAFEERKPGKEPVAKFTQPVSEEEKKKLALLIEELENHEDIQAIYTNT